MGRWRLRTWMTDNAYAVTLGCVLAMVVGCALYTQALREGRQVPAAAAAPEIRQSMRPTQTPPVTPLPTIAAVRADALVQRGGRWPVEGEVVRPFDAQQSVYWQALGLWQAHRGLDIAGEPGESVHAGMDGTVLEAAYDPLWGGCVRIRHAGDRETRYAGLESLCVQPGDRVRSGDVIGTLMERIPCEGEMGTHLHMEMLRGGMHQDPEATLAER